MRAPPVRRRCTRKDHSAAASGCWTVRALPSPATLCGCAFRSLFGYLEPTGVAIARPRLAVDHESESARGRDEVGVVGCDWHGPARRDDRCALEHCPADVAVVQAARIGEPPLEQQHLVQLVTEHLADRLALGL